MDDDRSTDADADAEGEDDVDPLAGRVDSLDLEDLLALERAVRTQPWRADEARRERERLTAQAEITQHLSRRHRRRMTALRDHGRRGEGAQTLVYSLRLDPDEIWALERRAALLQIPPRILARNLIRAGLCRAPARDALRLVDEVDAALATLRDALA